jgi:hypothetical protein
MLLTPEHFLRQERYFDSRLLWLLRYSNAAAGLLGGGPRLPEFERGAKGDDPVVSVNDDADTLSITVSQCRGITPGGCYIDIIPERPVFLEISKQELEGVAESRIYIVCPPHGKELGEGDEDGLNAQREKEWFPAYRAALKVDAHEAPYTLAVGRIVRARDGVEFDRDPQFIPACAFMDAHSELAASAREIQEEIIKLASRFTELHRAMRQFVTLFKDRGIDTDNDLDTLAFASRMVMALQNCVYEVMDTTQPPQLFFGYLRRFFHSAAVYLDLSPPVRQYFDLLKQSGETEFMALLAQQKKAIAASPKWRIHEDLSEEVTTVLQSLDALQRLERALEGKYIDFRVNPLLDAMNFIFDREGQVLYKLHAKSTRFQGVDDMRTITFAKMELAGREKYRLVLVGEDNAIFDHEIHCELYFNENTGMRGKPKYAACTPKPGQCNFDFDFEAPEIPNISDLRVTLTADHPIKVGMLFVRQRFYAEQKGEKVRPLARAEERPRVEEGSRPETSQREGTIRSRIAPAADRERVDIGRFRNQGGERPIRDGGTVRTGRDRDARFSRDAERDREPQQYDRDAEAPRRPSRDYDREPQHRDEWDSAPERSRDDESRRDDDGPPPTRRKRFQD